MKKIIFCTLLLLLAASCSSPTPPKNETTRQDPRFNKNITVGNNSLEIFYANTDALRAQGLSGTEKLTDTQGMLFEFSGTPYTKPGFWMKDMDFALDMIWIANGKIIGITKNIPPPPPGMNEKNLPLYFPPEEVDKTLEVNAGWSDAHHVQVGDEVKYNF